MPIADLARSLLAADPVDRAMFPVEGNGTINWVGRNSVLSRLLNPVEATNAVIRETLNPSRRPGSVVGRGRVSDAWAPWASRPLSNAAGQQVQNRSAFLGGEAQRVSAEAAARRNAPMPVQQPQSPFSGAQAGAAGRGGVAGRPADTPEAQARRGMLGVGMQSDPFSEAVQGLEDLRTRRGLLVQSR